MSKALVLHSGGLDSTVCLFMAVKQYGPENVIALGMRYGQKHEKELEFAEWTRDKLKVDSYEVEIEGAFSISPCSLIRGSKEEIDHRSYGEQIQELGNVGAVSTYVPYRNGLFLSYATAIALQCGCDKVIYGAHQDDAAGSAYPDCSPEFVAHQRQAIQHGTGNQVTLITPLLMYNKSDVVKLGIEAGMSHEDFEHTWSCYEGRIIPCGMCGTCRDRRKAFEDNGIYDII